MLFTRKSSVNEILNTSSIDTYFKILFPQMLLGFVPEELWDAELEEVEAKVRLPWGAPFMSDDLIRAANMSYDIVTNQKYRFVPLWDDKHEGFIPVPGKNNKESVFLLERSIHTGERKPAVIICPGGGYELLSADAEGIAMAERMEAAGYSPFVLFYRVKPNQYPEPQKDLALAAKYIRANADVLGIDPNRVMFMGSSAGGHLCASVAALHKEVEAELMQNLEKEKPALAEKYQGISVRPDCVCLNYPVISFVKEAHEPSFQALTGGAEALREKLSVELLVDGSYPKTYVWACEDDDQVPVSNTIRMGEALQKSGVSCRMRTFPTGLHGCGLAYGTSAEGWIDDMLDFMNA